MQRELQDSLAELPPGPLLRRSHDPSHRGAQQRREAMNLYTLLPGEDMSTWPKTTLDFRSALEAKVKNPKVEEVMKAKNIATNKFHHKLGELWQLLEKELE